LRHSIIKPLRSSLIRWPDFAPVAVARAIQPVYAAIGTETCPGLGAAMEQHP
jgi:hypothetical protein